MIRERKTPARDLEILLSPGRIILRGDLDERPEVTQKCHAALKSIPPDQKFSIIVEADQARLVPEGVSTWVDAVKQFLAGCELIYMPSQLGMILQYDDEYRKMQPDSLFKDYEETAMHAQQNAAD